MRLWIKTPKSVKKFLFQAELGQMCGHDESHRYSQNNAHALHGGRGLSCCSQHLPLPPPLILYTVLCSCGIEGAECPPWQRKICQKSVKRGRKSGKSRNKSGKRGKIRKVLLLCPSWQIGLATLLVLWKSHSTGLECSTS